MEDEARTNGRQTGRMLEIARRSMRRLEPEYRWVTREAWRKLRTENGDSPELTRRVLWEIWMQRVEHAVPSISPPAWRAAMREAAEELFTEILDELEQTDGKEANGSG